MVSQINWSDVEITTSKVELVPIGNIYLHTACFCQHCGCVCDKHQVLQCISECDVCCCHNSSKLHCMSCHKTCYKGLGKSYCCDFESGVMGEAGCWGNATRSTTMCCCDNTIIYNIALKPWEWCKSANQCMCIDTRCALPADDEVPMQIACCGCTLYDHKPKDSERDSK